MRNIEVQGRSIKMKDFLTNFMVSINVSDFFPFIDLQSSHLTGQVRHEAHLPRRRGLAGPRAGIRHVPGKRETFEQASSTE